MIYTIKNKYLTLDLDSQGAEAIHLVYKGINYLRERDEVWDRTAPILFPIVGRLKDGYAYYEDKKITLGVHGFAASREFKVINIKDDEITFFDKYDKETLSLYPFKYELYVTYRLNQKSYDTIIKVKNIDDVSYKYNVGGHPGIVCPLNKCEEFNDYHILFNKKETFASPSIAGGCMLDFDHPSFEFININRIDLDYKYFLVDAIVNRNLKSDVICLLNQNDHGIKFTYNGFNTIAFWTRPGSKYLCFEPWHGYADLYDTNQDFLTKPDLINIMPGEVKEVSFNIEII